MSGSARTARHKGDGRRWRAEIVERLEDFPRQYAALETAMGAFGPNFALAPFAEAFDTDEDLGAYNRVQAVERALSRVQNFVAELSVAGVQLAHLAPAREKHASHAARAFDALRRARVIDGPLYRRLVQAQHARSMIEHSYTRVSAGDVHRAAQLVHRSAREFVARYRRWVEPYLTEGSAPCLTDGSSR